MPMANTPDPGPLAVSLGACKAFLRLERDDDDAVLAGFIRTAMALCEAFTGQWLITRAAEARLAPTADWQRLVAAPVSAIDGVVTPEGALAADRFQTDIDAAGTGWVKLIAPMPARPVVQFRAGMGDDWNAIPEPLRQGIIRLAAHLYTHRDAADAGPPPAG
jgi:uncharacterized phiE125 gp8 family phage protein